MVLSVEPCVRCSKISGYTARGIFRYKVRVERGNDANQTWTRLEYLRMDAKFVERVLAVKREEKQQHQMKKARANNE